LQFRVARSIYFCYPAQHPRQFIKQKTMIRCHLSTLMGRDKLRISDVAQKTGLNRSTITALYNESATRIDLSVIDKLCALFDCAVADLLEFSPDPAKHHLKDSA
jgi:putative transcriptional regulator